MSSPPLLKSVLQHPDIASLGRDPLEQGRVDSFALDLAHWLSGDSLDSLGIVGRLILMVIHSELNEIRDLCRSQPRVAIIAAAQITRELWPTLRDPVRSTPLNSQQDEAFPILDLLGECSHFDVPEIESLAAHLKATEDQGMLDVPSAARTLMNGIPSSAKQTCQKLLLRLDEN